MTFRDRGGAETIGVQAVYARHANDGPLAQLAAVVAPCSLFAEEHGLVNTIGATTNWVQLSHAFANEAAYEQNMMKIVLSGRVAGVLGRTAARGFLRLPIQARYALLAVGSLMLTNAHRRRRLGSGLDKIWEFFDSVRETYGTALASASS